jgi:hypothetical protein
VSVRARALGWGLLIVALYVAGAIVSGHLSPLARRPLLDGFIPPAPYRWVDPPPELANSNLPPASGKTRIPIGPQGSAVAFFATEDAQVTLNVPKDAFPARPGSDAVVVTIEPVDPASVGALPGRLSVKGNVYLIAATLRPTGDRAQRLDASIVAILTYPTLSDDLGDHTLVVSPDGKGWKRIKTQDQHATKQVTGRLRSLGYLGVASAPPPSSGPGGITPPAEGIPLSMIAVVVGAALLIAGMFLMGRNLDRGDGRRR